jgi:hypothetical protein
MVVAVMAVVVAVDSTAVVAAEAAFTAAVVVAAVSMAAEEAAEAFTAALRLTAAAPAMAVGCTAAHEAAPTIIPAPPITIPVLHPDGRTALWVVARATATVPAIARE